MKKLFHLMIIGLVLAFACKKDSQPSTDVNCVFPKVIDIDVSATTQIFTIENKGNVDFSFSLEPANDFISIKNVSGQLPVGEKKEIEITIHRDKMTETKDYESAIYLTINEKTFTINVIISHQYERKIHLESDVIDAEYLKKRDILVYVARRTMKFYMFHTKTNVIESIDLDFIPNCVSVSPDQDYAVVGHDARISYIDLNSKRVIRTYSVSCNVFDIVFGDNNWAYAFHSTEYSEYFRCINLNVPDSKEIFNIGNSISGKSTAKLHPKGKYIYSTTGWRVEKFNIQNGTAEYLYEGYTNVGAKFWFSEDGTLIYGASKEVYSTSESQEQDMKYRGQIKLDGFRPDYGIFSGMSHSENKSNLYIILILDIYNNSDIPPSSFVYIYDASTLLYMNKIELEKFQFKSENTYGTKEYDPIPYFVFSNSIGDEVFVITKANTTESEYWAIEKIIIKD